MRIQHNIMAMNAYRNYNTNTSALAKNLEKLSSGYKINRAGDDAAGLAISEKMRAQITGLNAAQKNVKDGISLVKTAEGAMQEIQDMLNRMDYLATQSANGTYDNEVDRANLQKEVNALLEEIDRIADSANFNGIKLLNGEQAATGGSSVDDAFENVEVTATKDATKSDRKAQAGEYEIDLENLEVIATAAGTYTIKVAGTTIAIARVKSSAVKSGAKVVLKAVDFAIASSITSSSPLTIGGVKFKTPTGTTKITLAMETAPTSAFTKTLTVTTSVNGGKENQAEGAAVRVKKDAIAADQRKYAQGTFSLADRVKDGAQLKIGDEVYTFKVGKDSTVSGSNVVDLSYLEEDSGDLETDAAKLLSQVASGNAKFKVTTDNSSNTVYLTEQADDAKGNTKVDYSVNDLRGPKSSAVDAEWEGLVKWSETEAASVSAKSKLVLQIGDTADSYNQLDVKIGDMHTKALGIDNLDISNPTSAASAIQTIRDAINNVSSVRGDLGAVQNRLEHTANNLSVMAENIQDAESTIRDTDVAEEMMAYTKNNILIQSAQAMLAQANAVPQGVLQLLG